MNGYYGINLDSKGNYTYDQGVMGDNPDEKIVMVRDIDKLLQEERDFANIKLAEFEDEYLQEP